jgi:hypothetical protein
MSTDTEYCVEARIHHPNCLNEGQLADATSLGPTPLMSVDLQDCSVLLIRKAVVASKGYYRQGDADLQESGHLVYYLIVYATNPSAVHGTLPD